MRVMEKDFFFSTRCFPKFAVTFKIRTISNNDFWFVVLQNSRQIYFWRLPGT